MFIYLLNNDPTILDEELKQMKLGLRYLEIDFKTIDLQKTLTTDKKIYIKATLEEYNSTL